jgi:hypothetical protein
VKEMLELIIEREDCSKCKHEYDEFMRIRQQEQQQEQGLQEQQQKKEMGEETQL